jgi:hypothetical protein
VKGRVVDVAADVMVACVWRDSTLRILVRLERGERRTLGPLAPAAR